MSEALLFIYGSGALATFWIVASAIGWLYSDLRQAARDFPVLFVTALAWPAVLVCVALSVIKEVRR